MWSTRALGARDKADMSAYSATKRQMKLPGLQGGRGSDGNGLPEREWRIVEALYRLSAGGPKVVTYEDIVVKAWELYPDAFGLRGYSAKYPDASDLHKPLYNALKSKGWVNTGPPGQKKFSLTRSGWERAHARFSSEGDLGAGAGRLGRETELELRHLESTEAAKLFRDGKQEDILDTDFYAFYRTSVRAPAQEFEGRLAQVAAALDEAMDKGVASVPGLLQVDAYLRVRFDDLIAAMSERKKRDA